MTRKEKVSKAMRKYLEGLDWIIVDMDDPLLHCLQCNTKIHSRDNYCSFCGVRSNVEDIDKNVGSTELWEAYLIGKKADK